MFLNHLSLPPHLPDLVPGPAVAHLQTIRDISHIPAASPASVQTCRSTVLAWSRSPATPGTKTGHVGETANIPDLLLLFFYSNTFV